MTPKKYIPIFEMLKLFNELRPKYILRYIVSSCVILCRIQLYLQALMKIHSHSITFNS